MPLEPPTRLLQLLARLRLSTAEKMQAIAPAVKRLAGELPDFESLWIDALVQDEQVTPFQASRIRAGNGDSLLVGSYVLYNRIERAGFADCYSAKQLESGQLVRLFLAERCQTPTAETAKALASWTQRCTALRGGHHYEAVEAGTSGQGAWAVCDSVEGQSAAAWLAENGRLEPPLVLHIARLMAAQLAQLERAGVVHGDIGAGNLVLTSSGSIAMPVAGLRPIARASEGYSLADLPPEAYDGLAPERISQGAPASPATDLFACGALWWHLACGRPPFAGGNSLTKLQRIHAGKICDIRTLAPDLPGQLAESIRRTMQTDPAARPASAVDLESILGEPTRAGATALAAALRRDDSAWWFDARNKPLRAVPRRRLPMATAAAVLLAVIIVASFPWRRATQVTTEVAQVAEPVRRIAPQPGPEKLPTPPERIDTEVVPATANTVAVPEARDELILRSDRPTEVDELRFEPGQRVHARGGERARIVVRGESMPVTCDDVKFENVDFLWEATGPADTQPTALVIAAVETLTFSGCTFSSRKQISPTAIAWKGAAPGGGELVLVDCTFANVTSALDLVPPARLSMKLSNCLVVSSGPIVRLARPLATDDILSLTLDRVTSRSSGGAVEYRYSQLTETLGQLEITANNCVWDTSAGGALLTLVGRSRPDRLLAAIRWTGEGSLLTPHSTLVAWRSPQGVQPLSDEEMEVAGLVQSAVEFAGELPGQAAASRVTRWQAPTRSDEAPGANTVLLSLPSLNSQAPTRR